MASASADRSEFGDVAAQWPARRAGALPGRGEVFGLAQGSPAPVRVTTRVFVWSEQPYSLDVLLCDRSETPSRLFMIIGLSGDYLGPGEYKGGVSGIAVGLGVVNASGQVLTWTASARTASDLHTYGSGTSATSATCASAGVGEGPLFGPAVGETAACSVLFAWYELDEA